MADKKPSLEDILKGIADISIHLENQNLLSFLPPQQTNSAKKVIDGISGQAKSVQSINLEKEDAKHFMNAFMPAHDWLKRLVDLLENQHQAPEGLIAEGISLEEILLRNIQQWIIPRDIKSILEIAQDDIKRRGELGKLQELTEVSIPFPVSYTHLTLPTIYSV